MINKIQQIRSIRVSYLALLFSLIVSLAFLKTYRWDGNNGSNKKYVIAGDGIGYYAYLPAIFIDNNLHDLPHNPAYTNKVNTRTVNKYFAGTSLLIAPFFAVAYTSARVFDYDVDGYSLPFQFMVAIASVFYLFLGLFCLAKLLALFNVSKLNSAIVVVLILFGTNLLYYSVIACSMSHVYSFAMISCFALAGKKSLTTHHLKYFYLSAFLLGVIILIRPINGIVLLLIPVLSNNKDEFKELLTVLFKRWYHVIFSLLLLSLVLFIQPFAWHEQTGSFFLWSYSNEGFYFQYPQFFNVLFSSRKGLFIYTPLTLISLTALIVIFQKNKFQFYSILSFLLVATYIISCWWNWYYGDSFGLRAFIDFYPVCGLLLGILLENVSVRFKRNILLAVLMAILSISMVQTYQYYYGIIHPFSMNAEKYWYVFLKTSKDYRNVLGGNSDMEPYSKKPKKLIYSTFNDFENEYSRWNNGVTAKDENSCNSGTKWTKYCMYSDKEFGATLIIQGDSLFYYSRKIFVEATLRRLELENNSSSKALFVIEVRNNKNESQYYYTFRINDIPDQNSCAWKTYDYSFEIPKLKSFDDKILIYLWNIERQNFLVDDFQLNFYRLY